MGNPKSPALNPHLSSLLFEQIPAQASPEEMPGVSTFCCVLHERNMPEFSEKAAFCITHRINGFGSLSEKSPERASSQSPGLAALYAAYPGD